MVYVLVCVGTNSECSWCIPPKIIGVKRIHPLTLSLPNSLNGFKEVNYLLSRSYEVDTDLGLGY